MHIAEVVNDKLCTSRIMEADETVVRITKVKNALKWKKTTFQLRPPECGKRSLWAQLHHVTDAEVVIQQFGPFASDRSGPHQELCFFQLFSSSLYHISLLQS